MKFSSFKVALLALAVSTPSFADINVVKQALKNSIPDSELAIVKKSNINGLYEVTQGLQVFYVTDDGKHAMIGNIIDLKSGNNLTLLAVDKLRKDRYDDLDVSSMIVYPAKGKAKRTIAIFSDIDCPYCRKMHLEIPALNEAGIEVRYLAYPRSGVGGKSYWKAVSAWCAKNPAEAMDEAMLTGEVESKKCKNPVQDHMKLVALFGVNGTPNIITDKGKMLPGYLPAKRLIKQLGL